VNVYEVFLKRPGKDEFRHAGSLEAPDDEMAELYARETYARRHEGDEMWLVDRRHLIVADPADLDVNDNREHRHNDGSVIAGRRKRVRQESATESGR
jgi:ring-1,2-phenylacetyl-CoA epoxidase subunit PaaB